MKCAICEEDTSDSVLCSVCKNCFHAACTRLESVDKWIKKSYDERAVWKCDACKGNAGGASNVTSDPVYIALKAEIDSIKRTLIKVTNENTELRQRVQTLEITASAHPSAPTHVQHDMLVRDKIPTYIENEISKVPRLITDNPWTLIKFLDKLHLLNGMNEYLFKQIFQRLATYQANSVLLRLAQANVITFQSVARELLDELTTPHTKLKLVQEKILRTQYESENFRTYVEQVKKFNSILSQYSEGELVKSILQGANMRTRAKFQFSSRPRTFEELNSLVADVEKLELNESMQQSRNTPQSSGNKSKFFSKHSHSTDNSRPHYDRNQQRQSSPPKSQNGERHSTTNSNSGRRDFKNASDRKDNHASPKSSPQGKSFYQSNPNFNKKFKNQQQLQPFIPNQPFPFYYGYPMIPPYSPHSPNHSMNCMQPPSRRNSRGSRSSISSAASSHTSHSNSSRESSTPVAKYNSSGKSFQKQGHTKNKTPPKTSKNA